MGAYVHGFHSEEQTLGAGDMNSAIFKILTY